MRQCSQAACDAPATFLPAFVLPQRNGQRARRIVVPFAVCALHGALIGAALASPSRRADLARACGPAAIDIDWDRCRFELVPSDARVGRTGHATWLV